MRLRSYRMGVALVAGISAVALAAFGSPAAADSTVTGPASQTIQTSNIALKNAIASWRSRHNDAAQSEGSSSSSGPTGTSTVAATKNAGLPTGLSYTLDFSMAQPYGDLGSQTAWLPGGMDAIIGYGVNPNFRASIDFYELQHYPVGFNSGTVPLYVQGFAPQISTVNLATAGLNATTKDRFMFITASGLVRAGKLPFVISPVYLSRWSTVGAGGNDIVPFMYNGFPVYGVHARTAQYWALSLTLPFLSTPKMFGTFTLAPAWLTHLNGVNIENHAQLYEILYLEYNFDSKTKIFIQPQVSRDYLPPDPYAEINPGYFLGISRKVYKQAFVQLVLGSSGPTNYSPYGVYGLTCQGLPCSQNPVVPTVGGLKATQLQVELGVGTPSVIPF
jgi:hypothetical protein